MTGDFGPPQQGPEPESLTPESGTPKAGPPDPKAPDEATKEKSGRLARLRGRTPLTVAAAIVAVGAIAATSWGLARHGGGEEATPAPDNGLTFGPSQPTETASTGLPTFPTFPTAPTTLPTTLPTTFPTTLPTATLPTFPTTYPTVTAPYPSYPVNTYTYPSTTAPTTAPTTTSAPGNLVYPVAPVATPITECGTHGSIRFVKTTGVRYELTEGDGRKGRWVVMAEARPRYELGSGATTKFTGNLGRFYRCPVELGIRKVVTSHTGELSTDPWVVRVKPGVPEKEKRALSVTYSFATDVAVLAAGGSGWTCTGSELSDAVVNCSYDGGGATPAVSLTVRATDGEGADVPPSGTATLSADGDAVDVKTFDAGDA